MKIGRMGDFTYLVASLVFLVFGIVLLVNPDFTVLGFCYTVGAGCVIFGVVLIVVYFLKEGYKDRNAHGFTLGILLLAAGIFIFMRIKDISTFFPQFLAVWIVLSSIMKLQNSVDLLGLKHQYWWTHLIVALITTVLGGIVLVMPERFQTGDTIPTYISIVLIIDGVLSIVSLLHLTYRRKASGKIKEADKREIIVESDSHYQEDD